MNEHKRFDSIESHNKDKNKKIFEHTGERHKEIIAKTI